MGHAWVDDVGKIARNPHRLEMNPLVAAREDRAALVVVVHSGAGGEIRPADGDGATR
jgi:hypothetical protein